MHRPVPKVPLLQGSHAAFKVSFTGVLMYRVKDIFNVSRPRDVNKDWTLKDEDLTLKDEDMEPVLKVKDNDLKLVHESSRTRINIFAWAIDYDLLRAE